MLNAIMEALQAATVAQIRKAVAQPATRAMVSQQRAARKLPE